MKTRKIVTDLMVCPGANFVAEIASISIRCNRLNISTSVSKF